ncbi:hypothetical protein V2J92_21955 [Pseudomonas alliivorans]|nr:hypothetical protein [Pseudomonas alliivorans]MEE5171597.1 hypothetical protein [Pseudomonas alliivorans]
MEFPGAADLTLTYDSNGVETSAVYTGITVTLFYNEPQREWTVMIDDPTNQIPLDGLIRAVVNLTGGRRLEGAAQRPAILGSCFGLIED